MCKIVFVCVQKNYTCFFIPFRVMLFLTKKVRLFQQRKTKMSNGTFDKLTILKAREYKKSRGMYSRVYHIGKERGSTFCGEQSLPFGASPVTVPEVLDPSHQLPNGWHWCSACGSIFTGEPVEMFFPLYFPNSYQKNLHK